MRKKWSKTVSLCMSIGMVLSSAQGLPVLAAEAETETVVEADDSVIGELIFAQCEDYVNIRDDSNLEGEITAKIYNNAAATVVAVAGDWYEIVSGNAHGYVKAEYFATGEDAAAIAEKVAYNVATVHPYYLNIRAEASTDSEVIDVAQVNDQLEVVLYEGDWMRVALGNDVYGYINAYYVDYDTYYATAETLEEEAARLAAEAAAATAEAEETVITEDQAETIYTEPVETSAPQTDAYVETEPTYVETEPSYVETEPAYVETEPAYVETEPAYVETEPPYVETEPAYVETEPPYVETEPAYVETEPPYVETEPPYVETEAPVTNSDLGQSIANYACQFIGNPYVYGGTSLTSGADCSGFVQSVFANYGIWLNRTAADQSYNGTAVSLDNLQPGDLLFYSSSGGGIDHVAIYIGGGSIVHAANSNRGIVTDSAWYSTPVCATRCW